jgi:hypothetical protein
MRSIILALTAVVAAGLTVPANAARMSNKTIHQHMEQMKAQDPAGFNTCQTLASSRGYRIGMTGEYENKALMDFISGCLMGRQR